MYLFLSLFVVACITWYTVNIARVAWREGNRFGAVLTSVLAVLTAALPLMALSVYQ